MLAYNASLICSAFGKRFAAEQLICVFGRDYAVRLQRFYFDQRRLMNTSKMGGYYPEQQSVACKERRTFGPRETQRPARLSEMPNSSSSSTSLITTVLRSRRARPQAQPSPFLTRLKAFQNLHGKTTLRYNDQLIPDGQLDVAILCAVQSNYVIEDGCNCFPERARCMQTFAQGG